MTRAIPSRARASSAPGSPTCPASLCAASIGLAAVERQQARDLSGRCSGGSPSWKREPGFGTSINARSTASAAAQWRFWYRLAQRPRSSRQRVAGRAFRFPWTSTERRSRIRTAARPRHCSQLPHLFVSLKEAGLPGPEMSVGYPETYSALAQTLKAKASPIAEIDEVLSSADGPG